jgi:hypothetical protein
MTDHSPRERIRWLLDHPVWRYGAGHLGGFERCVDFDFVFVNPRTDEIDDDDTKNTAFYVWIEAGPMDDMQGLDLPAPTGGWTEYNRWMNSHDIRLDCGAPTMDAALLQLADLVERYYNDDGSAFDPET